MGFRDLIDSFCVGNNLTEALLKSRRWLAEHRADWKSERDRDVIAQLHIQEILTQYFVNPRTRGG